MTPTYSVSEIKNLVRSCNPEETNILCDLVNEEIDCYHEYESKAIFRMILLQKKATNHNEVKLEYLLGYN